jgi:hypothetical protein
VNDWAGFLALATRLSEDDGEAEHRSAISRAYYSAYNDARKYVRGRDPTFSFKDEHHWKVWDWFQGESGQAATLANIGNTFRAKRNHADYDVYKPLEFGKHEAKDAVSKARRILQILADLRANPPPPRRR